MIDPYEGLANGIILLAVKDWREAARTLKKWSRDKDDTQAALIDAVKAVLS